MFPVFYRFSLLIAVKTDEVYMGIQKSRMRSHCVGYLQCVKEILLAGGLPKALGTVCLSCIVSEHVSYFHTSVRRKRKQCSLELMTLLSTIASVLAVVSYFRSYSL
jgi:hypothetical protein